MIEEKMARFEAFLVVLLFSFYAVDAAIAPNCVWNLKTDLPKNDPIYIRPPAPATLIIPDTAGITLGPGESMTLVCSGKGNTIGTSGLQELTLACVPTNKLLYKGAPVTLKSLECKEAAAPSQVVGTAGSCAGGTGKIIQLGFTTSKGFVTTVVTCYDSTKETNLYSEHILYGKAIANGEPGQSGGFKSDGMTDPSASNMYTQASQKTRFATLLGASQADKYINTGSFLARGHVSPDADFAIVANSAPTYFLVNVGPQFQSVNGANWKKVENSVRKLAISRKEDMLITTGLQGVLQLPNAAGVNTDIYLVSGNKFRVPLWYWKVIRSPTTRLAIAILTLNNPFASTITDPCKNICKDYNWDKPDFKLFAKGYTICCDVKEWLPKTGSGLSYSVSGILPGPGA